MSGSTYKTSSAFEGTLASTTETITFTPAVLELRVINDSETDNLQFKFSAAENYRTLLPLENTIIYGVHVTDVIINSSASVAYRLWGLG
jgi:hypothetical protein